MPAHYRVRILPRASQDIVDACTFVAKTSTKNAAAVAQALLNAIDSLELMPHRYKAHTSHRNPSRVVRSMPVPPFIVYYQVNDSGLVVEIITVRHGRQRQPRRFR